MKTLNIIFFIAICLMLGIGTVGVVNSLHKPAQTSVGFDKAYFIDSTKNAEKLTENAKIDSLKSAEAFRTKSAEANAAYWENQAMKRGSSAEKYKNKADSLAELDNGQCRELIVAFRQANDTLKAQNTAMDSANKALDIEAESYSRRLFLCEKQSSNKDTVLVSNSSTINNLKAENNVLKATVNCLRSRCFWSRLFNRKCK